MKILIVALVFCSLTVCSNLAFAQSEEDKQGGITFAWKSNKESDLAGYKIYIGTSSKEYIYNVNVGNVTMYTVKFLEVGTEYFAASTAYDKSNNESGFSNEVVGKAKDIVIPKVPKEFKEVTTDVNP